MKTKIMWTAISLLGAAALGIVAFSRGEPVNALFILIATLCTYLISYRFYSTFISHKVLGTDAARATPATRLNDGLDYVPTQKFVLFGHHFAAIAGAGPLVGPVLAAQMGYLPGTLWILGGVVFAGAVQDMTILFLSTRRNGRSLGDMIRSEMGAAAGFIALIGVLLIMIILLAVLALIVVKALTGSPWGTFTVFSTLPIAILMGVYGRIIRPGKIAEMSLTLAVGMAEIFSNLFKSRALMGFWYHFAILFEALFILTALDAGTRVARFMLQDLFSTLTPKLHSDQSWTSNILCSALAVALWGYILFEGVRDPLGGINSLWPLFGISNQMLAAIALILVSVVLYKMKRERYAWVPILPAGWLLVCTLTAGFEKMFHPSPSIGFLAHADKFKAAIDQNVITPPASTISQMHQIVMNDYVDFALSGAFVLVVVMMLALGMVSIQRALRSPEPTTREMV
jgi:carbon starvation protein CstA